jgi:hypothetical protein
MNAEDYIKSLGFYKESYSDYHNGDYYYTMDYSWGYVAIPDKDIESYGDYWHELRLYIYVENFPFRSKMAYQIFDKDMEDDTVTYRWYDAFHDIIKKYGLKMDEMYEPDPETDLIMYVHNLEDINKNLEIFTNAKDEIMEAVNNELFETFREFFPEKLGKNIICKICKKEIASYEFDDHMDKHADDMSIEFINVIASIPDGVIPDKKEFVKQFPLVFSFKRGIFEYELESKALNSLKTEIEKINGLIKDSGIYNIKVGDTFKLNYLSKIIYENIPEWIRETFVNHTNIPDITTASAYREFIYSCLNCKPIVAKNWLLEIISNKKNYKYLVLREVNSDYQYIRTRLYYNGTDLYRFNNVLKNIVSDDEKDILIKKGSDLLKSNGHM